MQKKIYIYLTVLGYFVFHLFSLFGPFINKFYHCTVLGIHITFFYKLRSPTCRRVVGVALGEGTPATWRRGGAQRLIEEVVISEGAGEPGVVDEVVGVHCCMEESGEGLF